MIRKPFTLTMFFLMLLSSANAFAHAGLTHSSLMHSLLHIVTSISIAMGTIAVAYFSFRHLPKAIKQLVKK